ncbi:MAG: twin-arginine translocase TatA/TatE family subunit [bacterium]|nr:twin-arginine translocase TatA/TatE family subunit [bacterium]
MFGLGLPEIALIVVAVAVLFFGGKKIGELAKGLGRFTGEFKKGKQEMERELKESEKKKETT